MTDTWITLTAADVESVINDSELQTNLQTATQDGQVSPIKIILPDVTNLIRGFCRARCTLGPEGTIPGELKNAALDIILYRIVKRISGGNAVTSRRADNDAAMKLLAQVSTGDFKISEPLTVSTTTTSAPAPSIEPRHLQFGRDRERGI